MHAIGIGQCSWDYLALVAHYPEPDTKVEVSSLVEQGGGPVATACVALSRLGAVATFHGVTGDDDAGRKIIQSLEAEGVNASSVVRREGADSQVAFITVESSSARRTIYWKRPTGNPLLPDELPENFLDGADILMLDGLMDEVSLHAAKLASGFGVPVMVDAGRVRDGMLELCEMADYVVGSEEFARQLGFDGSGGDGFFLDLASRFKGVLTITLGAKGSVTVYKGGIIRLPAYEVSAIDTTGAGDAFHAGFAFGVMSDMDMESTLRFAGVTAALSCRGLGGRAFLPAREDVEIALRSFLKQ
jgi:ribokinase